MKQATVKFEFAGKEFSFETGKLAPQATAAVLAKVGETVVLVTVVEGRLREDIDYFPLSVEYIEKLYAGGRIKGSRWVKREGRPSDEAVLNGRLIDRSIRPLFPKEYKNEVQVIATVLSVDGENEPDIVALNAVSAALAISQIPWNGPIGAVRMGLIKDQDGNIEYLPNPVISEMEHSELDVVVSQLQDKTVMLEAGANQVPEDQMHQAIVSAHKETRVMLENIGKLVKEAGQTKKEAPVNAQLDEAVGIVEKSFKTDVKNLISARVDKESGGGSEETDALINQVMDQIRSQDPESSIDKKTIAKAIEKVMYKMIRSETIKNKKRVDGRELDQIRQITVEVDVLPRTHGSALFQRGLTQALTIVTLGSPRMEQLIESAEGEETKRYIHHYSGLPFSYGDTGRVGSPGRREIGHGALAERALLPVIPTPDKFPYTIHLVSEVLSQNGSSSMASTCGSTLALMDAGVPITKPVAGIVVGMMSDEKEYVLLTDIIGLEDFSGDMDFKVTGTDSGITAIQMDVKIPGLTDEQVQQILERAKKGREFVLGKMLAVLPEPKANVSEFAPKIEQVKIQVEKIGEVIGPGGKMIRNIMAQTGATIDVEDDGTVTISGTTEESVEKATDWIKGMTREVQVGETFEGEVKRILPFGAFVEILPGKEGMVHVSQMSDGFVRNPSEVLEIGEPVKVKVVEIDDQGRINLSMTAAGAGKPAPEGSALASRDDRGGQRGSGFGNELRRSDHPLSRQLRREQTGNSRGGKRGSKGPHKVRY